VIVALAFGMLALGILAGFLAGAFCAGVASRGELQRTYEDGYMAGYEVAYGEMAGRSRRGVVTIAMRDRGGSGVVEAPPQLSFDEAPGGRSDRCTTST